MNNSNYYNRTQKQHEVPTARDLQREREYAEYMNNHDERGEHESWAEKGAWNDEPKDR